MELSFSMARYWGSRLEFIKTNRTVADMSMTATLGPHLPYLRRYARALTGTQASGDTYVRAALSALLAGDQTLTAGVAPRVGLYRVFHAIWQSASGSVES